MACATYQEGPDENGVILEISVAAGQVADQAKFNWIYSKDGKEVGGVHLDLTFKEDGSFTAMKGPDLYAAGICRDLVCTYGLIPTYTKDGLVLAQTGTFKFLPDSLAVSIFAPDLKDGDFTSKGVLQKK